jgi:hypothetical protein
MKQFELKNNHLTLTSKPSPLFVRILILFFSLISILFPIGGMIGSMASGNRFHFGFLIGIGIFGLIGFYLLRVFLWNSYGKEVISISQNNITYEADYKWFKDGKKIKNIDSPNYSIRPIGYEDENFGALVISSEQDCIESVIKMPNEQLEDLILKLKTVANTI